MSAQTAQKPKDNDPGRCGDATRVVRLPTNSVWECLENCLTNTKKKVKISLNDKRHPGQFSTRMDPPEFATFLPLVKRAMLFSPQQLTVRVARGERGVRSSACGSAATCFIFWKIRPDDLLLGRRDQISPCSGWRLRLGYCDCCCCVFNKKRIEGSNCTGLFARDPSILRLSRARGQKDAFAKIITG